MVAGDITTQPKQGKRPMPMNSLCILSCLWVQLKGIFGYQREKKSFTALHYLFFNSHHSGQYILGQVVGSTKQGRAVSHVLKYTGKILVVFSLEGGIRAVASVVNTLHL